MHYAFDHAGHDRAGHLRKDDLWRSGDVQVLVIGGDVVASHGGRALRWLTMDQAPEGEWIFLGSHDDVHYAAVMVDRVPDELEPVNLRALGMMISPQDASLAVHAIGIARWQQTHPRCAQCGSPTDIVEAGHQRLCPECGARHFPRTDPAVIMLIVDGDDRALLGRQGVWPTGRFSTLAGFVEPGEALEDAVRREVMEEVGVHVGDVTYVGSQPWPFPASLMLGFQGQAVSNDIRVDADEIAEARWFTREEITDLTATGGLLLPPLLSISRWLIESWHGGQVTGTWN